MLRFVVWVALVILLVLAAAPLYGTVGSTVLFLLVGIALTEAWRSGRDWGEQRKNSIGGDYSTLTTGSTRRDGASQPPDGKIARTLHLTQRGNRVSGVETGEAKTQWAVSGVVVGEFVYGTYAQSSPATFTTRGAFHVKTDPQNPQRFHGQWIGWDPVKGALGQGEWEWLRQAHRPAWWTRLANSARVRA